MLYNITPFYSMQFCSHWCIFYTSPNKVYYYYQACKYTFFLFLINKIYCQYIVSCDILSFQTNNSFKYEKNFYRIISVGFSFVHIQSSAFFDGLGRFRIVSCSDLENEAKFEMSSSKQFEVRFIIFWFTPTLVNDLQLFLLPLQMYHFGSTNSLQKKEVRAQLFVQAKHFKFCHIHFEQLYKCPGQCQHRPEHSSGKTQSLKIKKKNTWVFFFYKYGTF